MRKKLIKEVDGYLKKYKNHSELEMPSAELLTILKQNANEETDLAIDELSYLNKVRTIYKQLEESYNGEMIDGDETTFKL